MGNIVVVGSSGHAKVVVHIARRRGRFNIVGLLDRFRSVGESTVGCAILGCEEDLPRLADEYDLKGVVVAIGDNFVRAKIAERIAEIVPDLPFVSIVHPSAAIAESVTIGAGTVVTAGVTVSACASVGKSCILNTQSSLDHDSVLEDFASLAPRATTGGNCHIGQRSAISIGAVLLHHISVGADTVIGAGSVVTRDVGPRVVAYGTPAHVVREREPSDKYL